MNAAWFGPFVHETVDSYRRFKAAADLSDLIERAQQLLSELQVTPQFAGFVGERCVQDRLRKLGYDAERSQGSRSPADVWGFTVGSVVHLPLFQVKTTRANEAPSKLTREDSKELLALTAFVYRAFLDSNKVPSEFKDKQIIVSSGYMGVHLREGSLDVDSLFPDYLGAHASTSLNEKWAEHEQWVSKLHRLD